MHGVLHRAKRSKCLHRLFGGGVTIPRYKYRYTEIGGQHGFLRELPDDSRSKFIFTCVRSPVDLYRSHYTFGYWKERPENMFTRKGAQLVANDPAISFSKFVRLVDRYGLWVNSPRNERRLGNFSTELIYYLTSLEDRDFVFYKDLDECEIIERFKQCVNGIRFLHCEYLSSELEGMLQELGYSEDRCRSAVESGPVNVSRNRVRVPIYNEDERFVRERELLFRRLFPRYG